MNSNIYSYLNRQENRTLHNLGDTSDLDTYLVPLKFNTDLLVPKVKLAVVSEFDRGNIQVDLRRWFNKDERLQIAGMKYEKRRSDYTLGRCAAKVAVAALTGVRQLSKVNIASGCFQHPRALCEQRDMPEISITHSNGVAIACAIDAGYPFGIDLEVLETRNIATLKDVLNEAETHIARATSLLPNIANLAIWTAKEALSKAIRCGLTVPFSVLSIAKIRKQDNGVLLMEFTNFTQYRCHTWLFGNYAFSLVFPKNLVPNMVATRLGTHFNIMEFR